MKYKNVYITKFYLWNGIYSDIKKEATVNQYYNCIVFEALPTRITYLTVTNIVSLSH